MKTNARQQLSHSDPSSGADEFDPAGAPGHGPFAGHEHARSETVARITPLTGHGGEPPAGGAAADWHVPSDATVDSNTGSTERRPMKTWILLALALVAAGVVTWMMMREPSAPADAAATDAPKGPLELATVDVATIESHVLTRLLPLSGSIAPFVQAMVKSKVAGEVEQVTVREGQDVQQGEVIARIDTRNLQAQYDRELAAVDKARADLDLAKLNRDKNRTLLEQRYISQNTYEATESAYAASVASFRLAEAQARLAKIELDDAVIRAPFAGTIATRLVQPGEKVSPDSAIVTLVDLRQMVLEAGVPAAEIPSVRVGQTARFTVGGFGEREFTGEVQRINPVTSSGSRAIMVYIAVANPDRVLKGGMFAQGQLTLDSTQPVLAVAQSAVRDEAGANYVYTLRDGKITRTPVRLGASVKGAKYVEVREGLTAGDRVIVANLADGKAGAEAFVRGETDTEANARVER